MRTWLSLLLPLAAVATADAQRGPMAVKVLGAQGIVWVLDYEGALHRLGENRLERESIDGRIVDITLAPSGAILALRERQTRTNPLVVERDSSGVWKSFANFEMYVADAPRALAVQGGTVAVITWSAVLQAPRGGTSTRVLLRGDTIGLSLQPALALTSDSTLYVGKNQGEFGGGLFRIDLRTGRVRAVERRNSQDLCAGPLNRACDPVTAVLADPDDSRCVLASVGLWHFLSHGRILRVCGDSVTVFFERPCPTASNRRPTGCTEAVFGLAADTDGFIAMLGFSVVRFRAGAIVGESTFPRIPEDTVPVRRSFALPGVALVWTNVNRQASMSGPTPLVAVRR